MLASNLIFIPYIHITNYITCILETTGNCLEFLGELKVFHDQSVLFQL